MIVDWQQAGGPHASGSPWARAVKPHQVHFVQRWGLALPPCLIIRGPSTSIVGNESFAECPLDEHLMFPLTVGSQLDLGAPSYLPVVKGSGPTSRRI